MSANQTIRYDWTNLRAEVVGSGCHVGWNVLGMGISNRRTLTWVIFIGRSSVLVAGFARILGWGLRQRQCVWNPSYGSTRPQPEIVAAGL